MNRILVAVWSGMLLAGGVMADTAVESVYARVQARSDLILDCTVVDEGPLGSGSSVQKSYQVTFEVLYRAGAAHVPPEKAWLHYDSKDYPMELQTGLEASHHKGERFVAFVDFREDLKGWEHRVVRIDPADQAGEIVKALKLAPVSAGDRKKGAERGKP